MTSDPSLTPSSFDLDPDFFEESRWGKFTRKLKEEPLIPLGMGVTVWALYSAAQNLRKGGDPNVTNKFFRFRLYAQSFTLLAMLGGSFYYNSDRLKRKEYRMLKKHREDQEKRDAWIRELEAREAEDQEWRTQLGLAKDNKRAQEERKALEKARAKRKAEAADKSSSSSSTQVSEDDGRALLGLIRRQHNAAKAGDEKMMEIEMQNRMVRRVQAGAPDLGTGSGPAASGTASGTVASPASPSNLKRPQPADEDTSYEDLRRYREKLAQQQDASVFGESEEGGFLGYKRLMGYIDNGLDKLQALGPKSKQSVEDSDVEASELKTSDDDKK